jgi:hypothetical protein
MIVVIDTSSLLSLVRYYLPFDKQNILYNFIQEKIESNEIIILDRVYDECKFTSKGIVVEKLEYIKDKKNQVKTTDLLPSQKFFNQLENQFINGSVKNRLTDVEFENRKNSFMESADAKLILYGLANRKPNNRLVIVSEETEFSNDNKSFKKIPAICKILNLEIISLPQLMEIYEGIEFEFK